MAQYIVDHLGYTLATTEEDCFIDVACPSGVSILLKRIRWAEAFSIADVTFRMRVYRASSTMTGPSTTSFTPQPLRDDAPASRCTVTIKNASAAVGTVGTTTDKLMDVTHHHRMTFEWVARDWKDIIETDAGGRLQITLQCSGISSSNHYFQVEWEE